MTAGRLELYGLLTPSTGAAHPEGAQEPHTLRSPACGAGAKEPSAVAQPKKAGPDQPGGQWVKTPGAPEHTDPYSFLQMRTTKTHKYDDEVTRQAYP